MVCVANRANVWNDASLLIYEIYRLHIYVLLESKF